MSAAVAGGGSGGDVNGGGGGSSGVGTWQAEVRGSGERVGQGKLTSPSLPGVRQPSGFSSDGLSFSRCL